MKTKIFTFSITAPRENPVEFVKGMIGDFRKFHENLIESFPLNSHLREASYQEYAEKRMQLSDKIAASTRPGLSPTEVLVDVEAEPCINENFPKSAYAAKFLFDLLNASILLSLKNERTVIIKMGPAYNAGLEEKHDKIVQGLEKIAASIKDAPLQAAA